MFKGTVITAPELLAEIGDCRARYPTRDTLVATPVRRAVAKESGKRKSPPPGRGVLQTAVRPLCICMFQVFVCTRLRQAVPADS